MFGFQSHLIFPTHAVPAPGPWPKGADYLRAQSAQGTELAGIHIPPEHDSLSSTLLLGFGGNAWNAQDFAEYLHGVFPDEHVVAFHYRGYAPSRGSPSAEALIADAPIVYDLAVERIKPTRIIAVGFSIGSGVAAQLSLIRPLDGLILVTPFDSLKEVAKSMFPWFPIGLVFEHEIDAASALGKSQVPVAIIAADRDEIVPAERTEALRRQVPNLVFDETIRGAGHNSLYVQSAFQEALRRALDRFKL